MQRSGWRKQKACIVVKEHGTSKSSDSISSLESVGHLWQLWESRSKEWCTVGLEMLLEARSWRFWCALLSSHDFVLKSMGREGKRVGRVGGGGEGRGVGVGGRGSLGSNDECYGEEKEGVWSGSYRVSQKP